MSKKLDAAKGNGAGRKKTTGQKSIKRKKKELTADEMLLRAWKKTYENRHKRLDV